MDEINLIAVGNAFHVCPVKYCKIISAKSFHTKVKLFS